MLKDNGELILVDMSILPEGEAHSLPFNSWEIKDLFLECTDESYLSKSGVPVVAVTIPKRGISIYLQFKSKLEFVIDAKRDVYVAVASNLSVPSRKEINNEFFVKLHLGNDYVHNFGYFLLLSGHANWRLLEEKKRVRGGLKEFNNAAKAILELLDEFYPKNMRPPNLFEIFDLLGCRFSYDALADSFTAMSALPGFFFPVAEINMGRNL